MNRSCHDHNRIHCMQMGLVIAAVCFALSGCSRGPSRVDVPKYDPAGSAARAMKAFDTNQDGFIAGDELDAAPSLKASMETLDTDSDGKVSESEIASRIRAWQATGTGLTTIRCQVMLDSRPLVGAEVVFEPEEFLGSSIQAAVGTTNREGIVSPKIPVDKRPSADTPPGIQLGFYRIRVSRSQDGREQMPAKYNAETILGQQIAPDDPAMMSQVLRLNLTTRD